MRESHYFYDENEGIGDPPDPLTGALPSIGNLTKRVDLVLHTFDPQAQDPVTRLSYDEYGNVITLQRPRMAAGEVTGETIFAYEVVFHTFVTAITNELGQTTQLGWTSQESCRLATPIGSGLLSTIRDPNAVAANDPGQIRCYDAFGRLESLQAPGGLAETNWTYVDTPASATITQQQWASGAGGTAPTRDRVTFLDGLGRVVAVHEDGPGAKEVRTLTSYDPTGRVFQRTGPQFSDAPEDQVTEWRYDVLDRVTRTCLPGSTDCGGTTPTGRVQNTSYEKGLVTFSDGNELATATTVDPFGRVVAVSDGSSPVTTYGYDAADQLQLVVSAGNQTQIDFDGLGRKISLSDPDAGGSGYRYDVNGNLRFLDLPSGVPGTPTVVEWEYDALDRPFRRRINGGSQVNWGYDGATNGIGRLSLHRTASFEHAPKEYDLLGRPTWERYFSPIEAPSHNFYTSYDPLGQVQQRTYPGGAVVQWTHDAKGYLTQIGTAQGDYATGIQWDALGRLQEWTAGNGFRTVRTYDDATARLETLDIRDATPQSIQHRTYGFDDGDRLTDMTITQPVPGPNLSLIEIAYEGNQLESVKGPFGTDRAQIPLYNSYDPLGNLTCRESTSASECIGGTALQYPTPGSPRPHAPTHVDGQPVGYDAMGDVTSIGVTQSYTYTPLGELSSASIGGVQKASFVYDGGGRLVRLTNDLNQTLHLLTPDFEWNRDTDIGRIRIELGGTTIAVQSFAYDPEQPPGGCAWVVPSLPGQGGSVLELFLPGLAALTLLWLERAYRRRRAIGWRPITALTTATVFVTVVVVPYPLSPLGPGTAQAVSPAGVTFYHADRLGSSIVISDSAGGYQQALYRPFGGAVPATGGSAFAEPPEFGFTGQRYVTGASLYHLGARAYHPALGRFIQPDPLVAAPFDTQNLNRYSYVLNNPLNLVDPTGLLSWPPEDDGGGGAGGGIKRGGGGGRGGAGGGAGNHRPPYHVPSPIRPQPGPEPAPPSPASGPQEDECQSDLDEAIEEGIIVEPTQPVPIPNTNFVLEVDSAGITVGVYAVDQGQTIGARQAGRGVELILNPSQSVTAVMGVDVSLGGIVFSATGEIVGGEVNVGPINIGPIHVGPITASGKLGAFAIRRELDPQPLAVRSIKESFRQLSALSRPWYCQ